MSFSKQPHIPNKKQILTYFILLTMVTNTWITFTSATEVDLPNLIIKKVIADSTVIEGEEYQLTITIENDGTKDIPSTTTIDVVLYIDDDITPTIIDTSIHGLLIDEEKTINLTWTATRKNQDTRDLIVWVDDPTIEGNIIESNENDNTWYKQIEVIERETDLKLLTLTTDTYLHVNKPATITAKITNLGKNTTQTINTTLFIDGHYYTHATKIGLKKGQNYTFTFTWIPTSFGQHIINVTIDPHNTISEQFENNNYKQIKVFVDIAQLEWWNASWHYRMFYSVDSIGIATVNINFTEHLEELQLNNPTFETNTITLVEYAPYGQIQTVISDYLFNESTNYNPQTNAEGNLSWNVTDKTSYYCVYFDVEQNPGQRISTPQATNLTGPAVDNIVGGSALAWWPSFLEPTETFAEPNTNLTISIFTNSYTETVTAGIYLEDNHQETKTLQTTDNLTWATSYTFTDQGNWTIHINAIDAAGYTPETITHSLFIGYVDLIVHQIIFNSDLPQQDIYYEGLPINISAKILCLNTTVEQATVNLLINDDVNATKTNLILQQDTINIISFEHIFDNKGTYTISIEVDPNDEINESNEDNNIRSKNITIAGIPDLGIVNITCPSSPVEQGDPVIIKATIKNYGNENAEDYQVNLYLDQNNKNEMRYLNQDIKNTTKISVNKDKTKTINLTWASASYGQNEFEGEWIVGVKIMTNLSRPDLNHLNNQKACFDPKIVVLPAETEKPTILLIERTREIEIGQPMQLDAEIYDESGIDKVTITIVNPKNKNYTNNMTYKGNNLYSYKFTATTEIGVYSFTVTATDKSENHNTHTAGGTFIVITDSTPPTIDYLGAKPTSQLPGKQVNITCIAYDTSPINRADITIIHPDETHITQPMQLKNGKYIYQTQFEKTGKYSYYVTIKDSENNIEKSSQKTFWITTDKDDIDSDGIPNWWEERYGLNPYNPNDAKLDNDDDGYTNKQEFKSGSNPNDASSKPTDQITSETIGYLIISVILFIVILTLAIIGLRRLKHGTISK